jgi:hypothetical protein
MNFLSYRHYHYYVSKSGVNQRPIQLILFDALGTLFCPLVSIGQQYVNTNDNNAYYHILLINHVYH